MAHRSEATVGSCTSLGVSSSSPVGSLWTRWIMAFSPGKMNQRYLGLRSASWSSVKRPLHNKLLANSSWETEVCMCERHNSWQTVTTNRTCLYSRQEFANYCCVVHTGKRELSNSSLPTLVCRVKAASDVLVHETTETTPTKAIRQNSRQISE